MRPYDRLTFLRNHQRIRDLRRFRRLAELYFEQASYDEDDLLVDYDGVRPARSQINRMLPRIIDVVEATHLERQAGNAGRRKPLRPTEVLREIFSARYADGTDQDVLDVLDMAIGIYQSNRFAAFARTINPLYHTGNLLVWVAGLPRAGLEATGVLSPRRAGARLSPEEVEGLKSTAHRLADVEELIEARFAELNERQRRLLNENAEQLADLAERLDFTERVLAQQPSPPRLAEPEENNVITPV